MFKKLVIGTSIAINTVALLSLTHFAAVIAGMVIEERAQEKKAMASDIPPPGL